MSELSLAERMARVFRNVASNSQAPTGNESLPLAAAVLLLEIEHADFDHKQVERRSIQASLSDMFSVSDDESDAILESAGLKSEQLVSLHAVVDAVNRGMDYPQRVELIGMMWRVAFADGELHPNEEHSIRRIADLLHVRHADFIRTRHAAES